MADYNCKMRSNYFEVKDPVTFEKMIGKVSGNFDQVHCWKAEKDGKLLYSFGVEGSIYGFEDEENSSFDDVILELQRHVAKDDAIIVVEAGYEKLRYTVGTLSKCEEIGLLRKEYIIRCPECSLVIKRAGYIKDLPLGPYECYGCSKKVLITLDEVEPVYTKKEETK